MIFSKYTQRLVYILCGFMLILFLTACSRSEKVSNEITHAPGISGVPAGSTFNDVAYSFTPVATDADGDSLTFAIANKPSWASFNSQTGELSGTPVFADIGSYAAIVISVNDGLFSIALPAFSIEVLTDALIVDAGADQTIVLPDNLTLDATVTKAGQAPPASTVYSWSKTDGPGIVTFDTPAAIDTTAIVSDKGSYQLKLGADNNTASDSVNITVNLKATGASGIASRPQNATECVAPTESSYTAGGPVPVQLSNWGCFLSSDITTFSPSVIPYDMNNVLWTDNADKGRFMAIPDGTTIGVDAEGRFNFPVGSVVGKHFWVGARIVETRLMLNHAQAGWGGYSYEWNDLETDATLLSGGKERDLGNNTSWFYPSPAECMECHTLISGFTIGPEVGQLNRIYEYPVSGINANQLITLESIGVMTVDFTEQQKGTAFYAIDDVAYTDELRARSYLHSNCAYCHQPGGPGGGNMDFRMSASLDAMGVCNKAAVYPFGSAPDQVIIAPGDHVNSNLVRRMEDLGLNRMPPLGTAEVDVDAMVVIKAWIDGIAECP